MLVDIPRFTNLCYSPSATLLKGDPRVMLGIGDGVCLEWRGPGNGGGLPRWYAPWPLPYFASMSEEAPIRPKGEFPYDADADGSPCCCWSAAILLGGNSWFGKLSATLLLVYRRPAEAPNMSAEDGLGRIGCG